MKAVNSVVERMNRAREERGLVEHLKATGKHRNDRSLSANKNKSPYRTYR